MKYHFYHLLITFTASFLNLTWQVKVMLYLHSGALRLKGISTRAADFICFVDLGYRPNYYITIFYLMMTGWKWKIHQSNYSSSWGSHKCLSQISWQSIKDLLRHLTPAQKCEPSVNARGKHTEKSGRLCSDEWQKILCISMSIGWDISLLTNQHCYTKSYSN